VQVMRVPALEGCIVIAVATFSFYLGNRWGRKCPEDDDCVTIGTVQEDKEWKIPFTVPYLVGNESKYVNEARFHNQIGPCHRRPLTRFTAY